MQEAAKSEQRRAARERRSAHPPVTMVPERTTSDGQGVASALNRVRRLGGALLGWQRLMHGVVREPS
jgi:hypothetical protein